MAHFESDVKHNICINMLCAQTSGNALCRGKKTMEYHHQKCKCHLIIMPRTDKPFRFEGNLKELTICLTRVAMELSHSKEHIVCYFEPLKFHIRF